jgi:CRISPR-associated protein Cas5d
MSTSDKAYEVQLEVAGPAAMFTRPDTGGTPTSYPVPTWSAAKGLFESIAFFEDGAAWICPTKVEVCRRVGEKGGRVHFQKYTNNYGGPLRHPKLFGTGMTTGGSSMQLFATILSDVCYRLYGVAVSSQWKKENNPRHHLQHLFNRRLKKGQCFRTPCLGWSEFVCSYWGPFRDSTEVDTSLSLEIPSFLFGMRNSPVYGEYEPIFQQDAKVDHGLLKYKHEVLNKWVHAGNGEVITHAQ